MPRNLARAALAAILLTAPLAAQRAGPLTRAERSAFRETSRYADVLAFLDSLPASPQLHRTWMGYTWEGRPLPLVVWGAVPDATPRAVRGSGRTVVYLQGNIHAGEVEGKEVLLALLRALTAGDHPAWADSLVLLVAPIYNADGNERVALDHRPLQLGPIGGMGQRPNAQGLDLNRDYVKLEAPETRSALQVLREYEPHVVVDLHTTNGTFHGYHLTYAPPLHPNTDPALSRLLREAWLPAVREALRREGVETYHYGNVPQAESRWAAPAGSERGWYSFDYRPRYGTHYAGLRNRFAILVEAYSYLPFQERIHVTRRFLEQLLAWAHAHSGAIRDAAAQADARPVTGSPLATRARQRRSSRPAAILMGAVDTLRHPYTGEPMLRRRPETRVEVMPEFIAFDPVAPERVPEAWLLPPELGEVAERLHAHGILLERLPGPCRARVEEFRIDSTRIAAQPFQGHRERTLWGRWIRADREIPAGTLRVSSRQPLGRLAFSLLEPASDDGLATWNFLDPALERTPGVYPVLREPTPATDCGPD